MQFIKIRLDSIKKNPNSGNTTSMVEGRKTESISFQWFESDMPSFLEKYALITNAFLSNNMWNISAILHLDIKVEDMFKEVKASRIPYGTFAYEAKCNHEIINHFPEPEYFFERESYSIECIKCEAVFPIEDLEYEDDEHSETIEVCPKCHAWNCTDIRFEGIYEAIKRRDNENNKSHK